MKPYHFCTCCCSSCYDNSTGGTAN